MIFAGHSLFSTTSFQIVCKRKENIGIRGCQTNDTWPQFFSKRCQFCIYDVLSGFISNMDIILIMNKFTKLRLLWNIQSSIWNPLNEHTYRRYSYWVMFTIVLSRRLRVNSSFLSIGYILAHSVDEIVKHPMH